MPWCSGVRSRTWYCGQGATSRQVYKNFLIWQGLWPRLKTGMCTVWCKIAYGISLLVMHRNCQLLMFMHSAWSFNFIMRALFKNYCNLLVCFLLVLFPHTRHKYIYKHFCLNYYLSNLDSSGVSGWIIIGVELSELGNSTTFLMSCPSGVCMSIFTCY